MKDILQAAGRAALRDFVADSVGVVLDFDGTLAPIVSDPQAAAMRPRTRALVGRVAERYPTAILSGRTQEDVAARVKGLPIGYIVGNHGAEWAWTPYNGRRIAERICAWHAALRTRLADVDGVVIEDKRYSLALHYRRARKRTEARTRILAALRELRGLVVTEGKAVVNVLAVEAPDKGAALASLQRRLGCARVIFVGDDANDEAAFAASSERVLTVRVGARRGSRASYFLRSQMQIDAFLELLARARTTRRSSAARRPRATTPLSASR